MSFFFGDKKIKKVEDEDPKHRTIHVLAFGQDDTVIHALNKFFGESSIKPLESIKVGVTNKTEKKGEVKARFRDETEKIK